MKGVIELMLRWMLIVVMALLLAFPALAQKQDLTILHFNDVYEIEPVSGGALGGAARVATLVNERLSLSPLILFSGDLFSPSIMSSIFQGSQMVDALNQLGVDYAVVGNHEFDFGPEVASQRFAESGFPWFSSNLVDAQTGEPYLGTADWAIADWNGIRVGLFGVVGEWLNLTSAGPNAQYQDFIGISCERAQALKDQGADIVIALTHMDMADDRMLAEAVPEIDLILGGHDHDPMHEVVNNTLIWKTGSDWRTLGQLKVFLIPGQKALVFPSYISVNASVANDPAMQELVDGYVVALDAELGQVIGSTDVVLDATRASVRTQESTFGNLIADASREFTGADVAIMNGGGIRTDQTYGPGELTRRDIQAVLPFGNIVITISLTGAELLAALENGVSQVENGAGRFPHVSGMTFRYDPAAPSGSRVLEATVAGQALDPNASYVVAINDFIGGGGDGFVMFTEAPRILTEAGGPLLAEVVSNYIAANSPVVPAIEGRITTP
jgi:2',3'-cyclic-nucleotide 2'-phosphodiesterase (5'-nucleotidase family)